MICKWGVGGTNSSLLLRKIMTAKSDESSTYLVGEHGPNGNDLTEVSVIRCQGLSVDAVVMQT